MAAYVWCVLHRIIKPSLLPQAMGRAALYKRQTILQRRLASSPIMTHQLAIIAAMITRVSAYLTW